MKTIPELIEEYVDPPEEPIRPECHECHECHEEHIDPELLDVYEQVAKDYRERPYD